MSAVTASFQGHGNTKTPMLLAGLLNIVNIITGYVFIFGFAFIPAMGIKGSAIALVLSQTVTALVGLILLFGKKGLYGGTDKVKFFIFDKKLLKEIYLIGIPAALESVFWQLSAMFLSKMILRYGSNAYASYQIGLQAEAITEMPAYGFGTAATTLIARAIGRGDGKSKKEYFKEMIKIGLIISSITSCLLIFFPGVFMNMMTEIE
ncbi:MAG: MATE family efflux transporter, partial [Oscillospiraceae bacterium]